MVVDTGANVTVVRPDVLSKSTLCRLQGTMSVLKTATGDTSNVAGKLWLGIKIGGTEVSHETLHWIGLCTYYRRFVRSFSDVARPLHELTEKGQSFEWTKACEESFQQLKDALVSAPVLAYPRTTNPFY